MKTLNYVLLFIILLTHMSYAESYTPPYLQSGINELNCGYDEWNIERFMRAEELFEKASNKARDNYLPYYWKGVAQFHIILFYLGDRTPGIEKDKVKKVIENAIADLEKAIALNPNDSESYALLGTITGMKIGGKPISALWLGSKVMRCKKQALSLNPENPRVHYLTGASYFHAPGILGGVEKSLEHFLRAEALFEQEAIAGKDSLKPQWGYSACLAFIAQVYVKVGNKKEAEHYYKKALRINPHDKLAQKGLAQLKNLDTT